MNLNHIFILNINGTHFLFLSSRMKTLHFYPAPLLNGEYANPYCSYFRTELAKYFNIVDTRSRKGFLLPMRLVWSSVVAADIYLFNWVENFGYRHLRIMQYLFTILSFKIIKWRKKELIWILHNIHPHTKKGKYPELIMAFLFKNADLIIAHSNEAVEYAKKKAQCTVIYRCHPVPKIEMVTKKEDVIPDYDILIWGTILPYKGIVEFLNYLNITNSRLRVNVIGFCKDTTLAKSINALCSKYISFSNRYVDFQELPKLITNSKYVVFPYIGSSISSSGALIDTIARGGNVIGPDKGAFKDLAAERCCHVYKNYDELVNLIENNVKIDQVSVRSFLKKNSWENFVKSIISSIK